MEPVNPDLQLVADFVNTVDLENDEETLVDSRALGDWLRARGLWHGRTTGADLAQALHVREALRELLRANNDCEATATEAGQTLTAAAGRLGIDLCFVGSGGLSITSSAGGVGPVLAAAGRTMVDGSWQRLKACRSDTCRWAFVDLARNRSRHWCSMETCGNREKARAFRKRRRGA